MCKIRCGLFLYTIFLSSLPLILGETYYELLGISKTADNREIRKAFKKLAVILHPDKNKDDTEAHNKFVKIARAYEILKDPDLRKKYDLYGEEDTDGSRYRQQSYQSWTYYRDNFGIYDDDPEIITLSRAEFEQSVLGKGGDAWFVNFYSPMCSHCHHLAPTWRRFARRVEGVVRVAAVNCEDDWLLCRNEGVNSYPTLVYYPSNEIFRGDRNEDSLVEFILKRLKVHVAKVTVWKDDENTSQARVLFFSDLSGDGPSPETRLKLAAMLEGLAWVGHVDCERQSELCERLGATSGTAVWPAGAKGAPQFVPGLEAQELLSQVLALLPELPLLTDERFSEMQVELEQSNSRPWLVYFHLGESENARLDLRRLPTKLPDLQVGRVDCARSSNLCASFYIQRYPVYGVFKVGGSYELHHGRTSASDVAQFARESASALYVTTLTPQQFSSSGPLTDEPLLVDYFAPWCPPCLRLLPELRKASQLMPGMRIGTVDCTVHSNLCRQMGVNSYPTTRLYNGTKLELFSGEHKSDNIVDFLQDMMNPRVQELTLDSFHKTVGSKSKDEIWVVDFYAPWCGPCQQLGPQWRKMAKMLSELEVVKVGAVNCDVEHDLCTEQGVRSYPTIRLYPIGSRGLSSVVVFSGYQRDASSLRQWVMNFMPTLVTELSRDTFGTVVDAKSEPWLVDFYAPWCGHCHHFAPEFEIVATRLSKLGVKCGKMDCDSNRDFCRTLQVRAYPTVRLFSGPHRDFGVDMASQAADSLVDLVSSIVDLPGTSHHDEL